MVREQAAQRGQPEDDQGTGRGAAGCQGGPEARAQADGEEGPGRGRGPSVRLHRRAHPYADASAVYGAYFEGINGGPSYQQLESEGKKWRRYKGGKDAWAKTALLGRFLAREEEKGDKEQAIAALQRLADSAGKKGNSKSPDWKEVLRRLRNTDEEKKRKTEIEEERESKKAKKAAGSGCEEE